MKHGLRIKHRWLAAAMALGLYGSAAGTVWAHCDTLTGPLIPEAQVALEKGVLDAPTLHRIRKRVQKELDEAHAFATQSPHPQTKELTRYVFR